MKGILLRVLYDSGKTEYHLIENQFDKDESELREEIDHFKNKYVYPMFQDAIGYLTFSKRTGEEVVINMQKVSEIGFEVADVEE